MYNVTQAFIDAIKQNGRQFKSNVTIRDTTFDDNSIVDIDLEENVNPTESFILGGVGSAKLEVTLINVPDTLILEDANVTATISLLVNGAYEDVPLGVFTVDDISKDKNVVKLPCFDNMIKLENAYFSDLSYPTDINNVANEICTKAGVELATVLTNIQIDKIDGYTFREAIGFIASFLGGFARFNRAGKLEILSYVDSGFSITSDNYFPGFKTAESLFTIGKLTCKVGDDILTAGSNGNEVQFENPIMTQDQLDSIYNTLKNLSYMPYNMDWQGNQALQAGDKITITDLKGNTYNTLLMDNKITYKGGLSGSASAVGKTETGQNFSSSGTMKSSIDRMVIEQANIKVLLADKATIEDLTATNAKIDNLNVTYATIVSLNAATARITTLETNSATITQLNASNANITSLQSAKANVTDLTAATGRISSLESTTASINTLMAGNIGVANLQAGLITATSGLIANGAISNAMIINLDVSKINAGDISTTKFRVVSDAGNLLISDNTIQIKDTSRVRVQIGKDASNDYNMYVWDSSGNLMFDALGLKASGIKDKIIVDNMVSDTANIDAKKLNITTLFSQMNGSTQTLKATRIYLDTQAQTLDVAFTSLSSTVTTQGSTITSQGTSISTIQGQISTKIWTTDITTAITGSVYAENVSNGNFVSGITGWTTNMTLDNTMQKYGVQSLKYTNNGASTGLIVRNIVGKNGDKYYVSSWAYLQSNSGGTNTAVYLSLANLAGTIGLGSAYCVPTTIGSWQKLSALITGYAGDLGFQFRIYSYNNACVVNIDGIVIINLTALFGAGYEPTKAWCDANIAFDILAKNAQTMIDATNTNISTNYSTTTQTNTLISTQVSSVSTDLHTNYSTTTAMNSAITASANSITASVSATYATQSSLSTTNTNVTTAQNTANTANTNAANAQTSANTAQTTANAKKRVFTAQPTTPYDVGDLWINTTSNGNNMVCTTARATGSYTAGDWAQDSITQRMSSAEASITVSAGNIALKVNTIDFNGNNIASIINQSATTILLSASKIDLSGYVTISSLGSGGSTVIDGSRITTGYLSANRISGGILTLGGNGNGNGSITINNASGTAIGWMDKSGLKFLQGNFQITNAYTDANGSGSSAMVASNNKFEITNTYTAQSSGVTQNKDGYISADTLYLSFSDTYSSADTSSLMVQAVAGQINVQAAGALQVYAGAGTSIYVSNAINCNSSVTGIEMYNSGWYRSTGAVGWYSQTYGGGWYMTDATWVRCYGDKGILTGGPIQTYGTVYLAKLMGSVGSNDYFSIGTGNCKIDCSGGIARFQADASNYISINSTGLTVYIGGTGRFSVSASGTKTGGTIDIEGTTYGMAPVDSPRQVIEDFYLNIWVDTEGTIVQLDARYARSVAEYGVWPSNADAKVISKDATSFVIKGYTGIIDIRVVGYRKDSLDYYYPVMDSVAA